MKRLIAGIIISCIMYYGIQCIIVGSNTAVSIQATPFFPTSGNADNEMRGFAAFTNGFTLETSTTRCLFTSQFPMSGSITMNGGTLNLGINCMLTLNNKIYGPGIINGNNYTLSTPPTITTFAPIQTTYFRPLTSTTTTSPINSVDWSFDDLYVAAVTDAGAGTELNIYSFNGTTLTLAASVNNARSMFSVRWNPLTYFLVVGTDSGAGNDFLVYQFTPPSTLTLTGGADVGGGGNDFVSVAWRPDGSFAAAGNESNAQELTVYGISGLGVVSSTSIINLAVNRDPLRNSLSWHPSGLFFAAGFDAADQLVIGRFNGVTATEATTFNTGGTATALDWSKTNSLIVVGLTGTTENIKVFSLNTTTTVLTEVTTARVGETNGINSIQWKPDATSVAVARATGTAAPLGFLDFNSTTSVFTAGQQIGTPNVVNALRWSRSGTYLATGDTAGILQIYDNTANTGLTLQNITFDVQSNFQSSNSFIFSGTCVMELNNNTFDCTSSTLTVTTGSILTIRNGIVKGLSDGKFSCVDGTGMLILDNVECVEAGNLTYGQGSLTITNDVQMTGGFSFTYTSARTLTINSNSTLAFDSGMTFSYAPGSGGSNSLLSMVDQTSKLYLYETTLHAPSTGLRFTKGTVVAEGECPVVSRASSQANGILFGDGLSAANNATLKVLAESTFHLLSGFMLYQDL